MLTASDSAKRLSMEELRLARLALDLGAERVGGEVGADEDRLRREANELAPSDPSLVRSARAAIMSGADPLGAAFCRIRPASARRSAGAFYTPPEIVEPMLTWALCQRPARVVDAGCGSGRFAAAIARRRPDQAIVAVDSDPLAALMTRAALAVLEARDVAVLQMDYTRVALPPIAGRTAFIGNPPYVRHHDLSPAAKAWALAAARRAGHRASGLAGLHAHFFLATAHLARPGDVGCFVTSAEWLDVNYGSLIRDLLLGRLGGISLHVVDPRAVPFEDAMTTAVVACFEVGRVPWALKMRRVASLNDLGDLDTGVDVPRSQLAASRRWSPWLGSDTMPPAAGAGVPPALGPSAIVPLSTIAAVHRGIATGANDFFVLSREQARSLGIEPWCRPAVTSAEEILSAGGMVRDGPERRLLLHVPKRIDRQQHPALDAYLHAGETPRGNDGPVCNRYLPRHRKPWWYLGPSAAPPIVASYMARQPPVFALNPDGLALINIGHGIFPHEPWAQEQLEALVKALNSCRDSFRGSGRTYHGGLEKFEPREMESLPVGAVAGGAT